MLMRFSVSNFMSFRYEEDKNGNIVPTEFTMYAGRVEQFKERIVQLKDRKVLKFAATYGANAAGKSNLITALDCGKNIVLFGMNFNEMKIQYCRCVESNKNKPTLFEYEFSIEDKCYAYGFTVNLWENKILSEWLVELENEKEHTIFERDCESEEYYFDEDMFQSKDNNLQFHFFMKDANRMKESLLIYELERRHLEEKEFEVFRSIYTWFKKNLVIIYPETELGESYFRFGSDNKKLVEILKYFDTGITDYHMQKLNENAFREYFTNEKLVDDILRKGKREKRKGKTVLNYRDTLFELDFDDADETKIFKILFQHGNSDMHYEYGEESDGTRRLIELLEIIMNDKEGKTFVVDELDRSLHPQMTKKFVETFFKASKGLKTQLITTTHESNLMDLELLRRDEIWFAERENDHSTSLYSLEKFKVRYDKVPAKDYLNGRYGAVPVFKEFEYVWGNIDEEAEFTNA